MRPETACGFALFCLLAGGAHANDPAYVDSPANKSNRDPARADGGERLAEEIRTQQYYAQKRAAQNQAQQKTNEELGTIREQLGMLAAGQSAAPQGPQGPQDGYRDPPIGGRDLVGERNRSGYADAYGDAPTSNRFQDASPGRQIGSGLMQDAAGVVESRMQNEINGNNGRVYLPTVDTGERPPGY